MADVKKLRIWFHWPTACAAGQEAYSLAMLIEEFQILKNEKIQYRIFATDHSEDQIHLAQKGLYFNNSIQNLTLKRVNDWFEKSGDASGLKQI